MTPSSARPLCGRSAAAMSGAAVLAAILIACAGPRSHSKAPASGTATADAGDDEKVAAVLSPEARAAKGSEPLVCEWGALTGSHIPQRVCRTEEEMNAARAAARRFLDTAPHCPPKRPCVLGEGF